MPFPWDDDEDGPVTAADSAEASAYLTFDVGRGLFALDVSAVHEILDPRPMLPVPGAPPHVLGTFDLRGNSVLAMDGGAVFDLPRGDSCEEERLIVVAPGGAADTGQPEEPAGGAGRLVGIAVDRVHAVEEIETAAFHPPPGGSGGPGPARVRAICRRGDTAVMRIDIGAALSALGGPAW